MKTRNHTTSMMEKARRDYYADFISENSTDQRKLFKPANMLLGRSGDAPTYPPHTDAISLANDFGRFFVKKITDIRATLDVHIQGLAGADDEPSLPTGVSLANFEPVITDTMYKS